MTNKYCGDCEDCSQRRNCNPGKFHVSLAQYIKDKDAVKERTIEHFYIYEDMVEFINNHGTYPLYGWCDDQVNTALGSWLIKTKAYDAEYSKIKD